MAETNNNGISRHEIKAAIARAVELRAIHAALIQGGSPTHSTLFSSSSSPPPPQLSVHDYPIFTPSYEDEPIAGYQQLQLDSRALSEAWEDQYELLKDNTHFQYTTEDGSSRKNLALPVANFDAAHSQAWPADHDTRSVTSSCTKQITALQTSPSAEHLKSRRKGKYSNNRNGIINDADSMASSSTNLKLADPQPKSKGMIFSWLLPRSKKKPKGTSSPLITESEEESRIQKGLGAVTVDTLKKELLEANQKRDAALAEVAGMKSSFGDLRKKLENLEGYCEELKRALRQAVESNGSKRHLKQELIGNCSANSMPVSDEAMVEGFLQIVSEARLSVKRFCKTLIKQIEESDAQLIDNLHSLLQPYKVSLVPKSSKAVLYHLEAIINQELYQDFENCVFQRNGTPRLLDPQLDRQARFSSFVALRNLSWNEVMRKGTKFYSEELSGFCDQKMSCIISALSWIRPWPQQLLQTFFVAAKCIWLLHLLAFSFDPPLTILRVEENRQFDAHYMEEIAMDRQRAQQGPSRVKIMVMPGFYVQDKILKCKVL